MPGLTNDPGKTSNKRMREKKETDRISSVNTLRVNEFAHSPLSGVAFFKPTLTPAQSSRLTTQLRP